MTPEELRAMHAVPVILRPDVGVSFMLPITPSQRDEIADEWERLIAERDHAIESRDEHFEALAKAAEEIGRLREALRLAYGALNRAALAAETLEET